jgi:hypothetical protein
MSHQQPPNTNGKIIIFPSKNTQNLSTENETILHMKELAIALNQQTLDFAIQANKKQPSFLEQLISVKTKYEFVRFVIMAVFLLFIIIIVLYLLYQFGIPIFERLGKVDKNKLMDAIFNAASKVHK